MVLFDLVICGAGPAGSTTARTAAKAGQKVLLVDKDGFPRDKVCGGGLRPEILESPEFSYVAAQKDHFLEGKCTGVRLYGSRPDHFIAYDGPDSEPLMYGTSRRRFDEVLFRLARDAGAEVQTRATVKKVKVAKEYVEVVFEDGRTIRAHIVVGAGGMQDPVAKLLREREGLPRSWPSKDIGFAVAHEFEVGERFISESFGESYTCHFHMKPQGIYGYAWAFPRRSSINVGYGAFLKDIKKMNLRAGFKTYITLLKKSGLFPRGIDHIEFRGARIPLRGPIKRTVSDRTMLVGDAAGFVSPLGGDGISFAMASGMLAARTAIQCLEVGDCSSKGLSVYEREWKRLWGKDFRVLCDLADMVERDMDRIIEVCRNDKVLVRMLAGIYNGRDKPSKVIGPIMRRYLKNAIVSGISRRRKKA
jgi:geranylgeranyl reductase family protein